MSSRRVKRRFTTPENRSAQAVNSGGISREVRDDGRGSLTTTEEGLSAEAVNDFFAAAGNLGQGSDLDALAQAASAVNTKVTTQRGQTRNGSFTEANRSVAGFQDAFTSLTPEDIQTTLAKFQGRQGAATQRLRAGGRAASILR